MGSKRRTILNEVNYRRSYKDQRKQHLILHQWNEDEGTHMGEPGHRSSNEDFETEKTWPTT